MATAEVVEEVAENLEEAAVAVRKLDTKSLGFLIGGLCVGIGVGVLIGYRLNKEKLRAEAFAESEEEVEKIRQMYQESTRIVSEPKPKPEEIVEEHGYREIPPREMEEPVRPLPPPVPIQESEPRSEPRSESIRERVIRTEEAEKDKNDGWSYPYELSTRRPSVPFIIHQDEYFGNETEYGQTTYTYYAGDDVLADTDETVLHNRENLIGPDALTKFGHGSDDYNVVYVRNTHLELEMEICRVPHSYEENVQGLEHERTTDDTEPDRP